MLSTIGSVALPEYRETSEYDQEIPQSQTSHWHRKEGTQNTNSHATVSAQLK